MKAVRLSSFLFEPVDYRPNGFRIQYVFLLQNSSRKCFDRVVVEDWDGALSDDRAAVERVVDEVDRASADRGAVIERLSLRVETGKQRQQARVDVEDALRKRVDEKRRQHAHVTCETNQIDAFFAQDGNDLAIVFLTFTSAAFDDKCSEPALFGGAQAFRVGLIADYDHDLCVWDRAVLNRIGERNHVRS